MRSIPGAGLSVTLAGGMQHVTITPELLNPLIVRQGTLPWFIGQIVAEGPDGEEDHEGAVYWVREMSNTTGVDAEPDARLEFMLTHDAYDEAYGGNQYEMDLRPARWVTATNLGEYNMLEPETESHTLVFGGASLVHVFQLIKADGIPRWFFDRAAGGGTKYGVVRIINGDDEPTVGVQAVQKNTDTDLLEFVGDIMYLSCWGNLRSRHYKPHLWPPAANPKNDPVFPEVNIMAVTFVDGEWRVEQTMRWSFPPLPPEEEEYPISDCDVVRPTEIGPR
jgi:hypothetical protein